MKKKVILIHQVAGYMMIDIVNSFASYYDNCTLLTGELRIRNINLNKNVNVKSLIKYNSNSKLSRFYTWFIAFFKALFVVILSGRKTDLFITSNPPFSLFIPLFVRNRYSILVYDVYPDVIVKYNILSEKSIFTRMWRKINRRVFQSASKIYTISEGMKILLSNYISPDKIKVVPCWSAGDFFKPIPKDKNLFIKNNKFEGKFLVIYSGNLGFTHDIEVMVQLAVKTRREDVLYIIIGEGEKKKTLADMISTTNLKNIIMLPWQTVEMLPYSLGAADLGVVTLGKGASQISVPSKLYDLMAVGAPVLSIAERDTEMARLISDYQMGLSCPANEIDKMISFIDRLIDDEQFYLTLRNNSYNASKNFTSANASLFTI